MITRIWHGYAAPAQADAYEQLLKSEILPGIHRIAGYRGATLLRREQAGEVEFITLTYFDDMDSVHAFAGDDYERCVVPEEARKLLSHYDQRVVHYDTIFKLE